MLPNATRLILVLVAAAIAGCGSSAVRDGPPSGSTRIPDLPDDAVPRPEAKSRYGNGPVYEVLGKRYTVMPSSAGYKERGVASWYGKKFHGNLTSNREVYDMHAMTAAHKTLPLPTYVRVRNLSNGREVIVRVNDRGPFVHNRIIDLSYSAALKLDMVGSGTGLVEVEAISFDKPSGDRPVRQVTPPEPVAAAPAPSPTPKTIDEDRIFVQVGAFGSRENAERRLNAIRDASILASFIVEDTSVSPALYRVRIGPIRGIEQYDLVVEELEKIGIPDPYLINE
jgi:rare lipoprotein A